MGDLIDRLCHNRPRSAEVDAVHEMALTDSVVRILEQQAVTCDFRHVRTVWLEIGVLSQVEPEAMRFCFEVISRGTVAEGARLEILRTEGQALCLECGQSVSLSRRYDPCPACGSHRLRVTGGAEMRVKDVEVD